MPAVFNQTASAAPAGKIAACSGATPIGTQAQNSLATVSGTAGGAVTVGGSQFDIGTNLAAVYMEIDPIAGTGWKAGNYVVRMNVTTLNANITWTGTYICRLNSSNVSQATIGSLTGQTTSLGTTGVKTHTVSGSAQTPSAGDKIYIVCVFTVVTANNQSFGLTWNQGIDTPLVVPVTFAPAADAWGNLADARATTFKAFYKLTTTDAWQNLADSVTAALKRKAWRDSVAVTLGTVSGTTPKTFSGSDSLNLWADSTKEFVKFFAGLTDPALNLTDSVKGFYTERAGITDAWNNLSDSSAILRKGYLKPSLSDAWNNLNDSLAQFQKGYLKPQFTDAWQNLADSLATLRKGYLKLGLTDPWGNLNDSVAGFFRVRAALIDALNLWSDLVAKTLTTGLIPKTANLTDSWLNLADALAVFQKGFYKISAIDSWNNLDDQVKAFERLRVALSETAANLLDSLLGLQRILANLGTDIAQNLSDSIQGFLILRAQASDDATYFLDLLDFILTTGAALTPILADLPSDDAAFLLDALSGFMRLSVKLKDENMAMQDQIVEPGGAVYMRRR